jgi:hypothetical protein
MGASRRLLTHTPNIFEKSITFDSGAGSGALGTVAIGTVTGSILITRLTARVLTTLIGISTLEMGVAGNTAALIAQVANVTTLADGDWWTGANSPVGIGGAIIDKAVEGDIILTVAGVTFIGAGKIEFIIEWFPLSADGNLG